MILVQCDDLINAMRQIVEGWGKTFTELEFTQNVLRGPIFETYLHNEGRQIIYRPTFLVTDFLEMVKARNEKRQRENLL